MPKIKYQEKRFDERKMLAITRAERICNDYERQGYDLTLRQLYYQFVARDWLPNTIQSYKWLGDLVNDARLAGLIDWNHITDRTRNLMSIPHFNDPAHAIKRATDRYQIDMWANQPEHVEVWVEKEALAGIIARAASAHDCAYFSCRGYTSQSEMWGAAQRIGKVLRKGKNVTILHLGDHDPSGIDMTRDIVDRLDMFIKKDQVNALMEAAWNAAEKAGYPHVHRLSDLPSQVFGRIKSMMEKAEDSWGKLHIDRIALNMDQVEQYSPPPNPAKVTDPRAKGYIEIHGDESWELDALDPATLDTLIQSEIVRHKDQAIWDADEERMERHREVMSAIAENWRRVQSFAEEQGWVA
jgi:hypothetical protein